MIRNCNAEKASVSASPDASTDSKGSTGSKGRMTAQVVACWTKASGMITNAAIPMSVFQCWRYNLIAASSVSPTRIARSSGAPGGVEGGGGGPMPPVSGRSGGVAPGPPSGGSDLSLTGAP